MAGAAAIGSVLVKNGLVQDSAVLTAAELLKSARPGVYTTSRTARDGTHILFWDRHLQRLCQSLRILAEAKPNLYPIQITPEFPHWNNLILPTLSSSLKTGLSRALEERRDGEELSVTALVTGSTSSSSPFDVHVHISKYSPMPSGVGAHLAVVGPGREMPSAKASEWVRIRQCLEKFRAPPVTEFLLSNDGDGLLEGSKTNFFVVSYNKDHTLQPNDFDVITQKNWPDVEVQTASIPDGVLPGIIRQVLIEICAEQGIPLKEVKPSLSACNSWKEAFVTSSLRVVQHVELIQSPSPWNQIFSVKNWEEVTWKKVQFGVSRIHILRHFLHCFKRNFIPLRVLDIRTQINAYKTFCSFHLVMERVTLEGFRL